MGTSSEYGKIVTPQSRWAVTRYDWQAFGLYLLVSGVLVLVAVQPGATRDQVFTAIAGALLLGFGVAAVADRLGHRSMWRRLFPGLRPVREWLAGAIVLVSWMTPWFIIVSGWDIHGTAVETASWLIWFLAGTLLADLVGKAVVPRERPATPEAATGDASV